MQDIRQKLLAAFQVEYRDHIGQIRSILALIANTGGSLTGLHLDEAFRRAHTLKGAARVVELRPVEQMAHGLESLFAQARQGGLALGKEAADLVSRALDEVEDCVAKPGEPRANAPLLEEMEKLLARPPQAAPEPPAETVAPEPSFQPPETVRVDAQNFGALLRSAVELRCESQRQALLTVEMQTLARQIGGLESRLEGALKREARAAARQLAFVCRLQRQSCRAMTNLSGQLERDVLKARMAPVETLFEGYRKMMRDLARDEAKQIDFAVSSTGERADRRILEALKDPLMHALRNAVSHGIELPHERLAKGKPSAGCVVLRIESDGQRLKISVEDDGRGIDTAKILEVAVRRKVLSEAEASSCSPRQAARLLFTAGFSTSTSVGSLSGRGMGMSVVYETVRALNGEVEMEPRAQGGASLTLSVPVSISAHRLLLASAGGRTVAIPLYCVERLHRVRPAEIKTVEGTPALMLEGAALPVFNLRRLLNLPEPASAPELSPSNMLHVLIVPADGRRNAIVVDAVVRQTDAVIQDLGPATPSDGKISGGVLLEDGSVALVISPGALLRDFGSSSPRDFMQAPPPAAKEPPSVLVVDDSITTRTLEKSILETQGYRVRVAVDGVEALAYLREKSADLVISDVQMPRMDGFALLEEMKKDRALSRVPVIMVTSLEHREDRQRGLSLGADAYIVKRKFDQGELLAAIRQIL